MPNKAIIITTGLTGLVGSRFQEIFQDKYSFHNLDLVTGIDITREKDVKKAIGNSDGGVIVHFAAYTDVDEAFKQSGDKDGSCYRVNVLGTHNVAQYSKLYNRYLIHISTDFVFSGKKQIPYTEADIPDPIEWYGKTKYLAEKEAEKAGGKHAVIRISFPFRARYNAKMDLVRTIINKLETGRLHPMFSDQTITPTFIDDIAKALDIFIKQKPHGIYHVVGSSYISPFELAKKIAENFNYQKVKIDSAKLEYYLKTAARPYQSSLMISNQKIRKELGIKMSDIDTALATMKQQLQESN